jgi:hypothetical protein
MLVETRVYVACTLLSDINKTWELENFTAMCSVTFCASGTN